jgi:hypothetical protein
MSLNSWGKGELRSLSQCVQPYTGAQINFGDPTQYLTYESVCPFVGIGSPHTLPVKRVFLLPWTQRGEEQHFLVGERVGDPIRTTGKKAWHSVCSVSSSVLHWNKDKRCFVHFCKCCSHDQSKLLHLFVEISD